MTFDVTLAIALAAGVAVFILFYRRERADSARRMEELSQRILDAQRNDPASLLLQKQIDGLRDQLARSLADSARLVSDSQKSVGERLDRAAEVVGRVQNTLGSLTQATEQVFSVGKDIAALQDLLRAPKMRGAFGELFLGDLLAQILPSRNFALQHAFKNGETVDAVVRIGRLVPVDAKFPLENFKRISEAPAAERPAARRKFIADVKRHIDAIASKYLRPDENTFDFALMYIPAENVYYETIIKDDAAEESALMNYAFARRVVPVSPNSFFAYLQTISLGLRGLEIEENARAILGQLDGLKGDFGRFKEEFSLVGKHLGNARGKFDDAERKLNRFGDKLSASGTERARLEAAAAPALEVQGAGKTEQDLFKRETA